MEAKNVVAVETEDGVVVADGDDVTVAGAVDVVYGLI